MIPILLLVDVLALRGGTVHTFVPGAAPAVATVLVENGYVTAVGPDVAVPEGARVVDLAGAHLMPGLIDGYVNFDPDHDVLYVSAGITCVRDVGNELERIVREADRNARERTPGPWIWCAGPVLDGTPPCTSVAARLDSAFDVESKLPRLLEYEAIDYFSFHAHLTEPVWALVLERARAAHKQVWGPLPKGATLAHAIEKGQSGVYQLDAFLPPGERWETVGDEALAAAAKVAGDAHLAVTPTLAAFGKQLVPPPQDAPQLAYLSPFYEATWKQDAAVRGRRVTEESLKGGLAVLEKQLRLVRALHAAGARIVPGSGAPNPWLTPGEALLDELSLLHRAGVSAAECVRLATAGAAEATGMTKRGTIERGKVADFVVTQADPEADLSNLVRPSRVVLRGRVLERAELDDRLARMKLAQAELRAQQARPLPVAPPDLPPGDPVLSGYVETRGLGTRVSAERYAVVRGYDGSLTYCGRMITPGDVTTASTETRLRQTIESGELAEFDLEIVTNGRLYSVHGERTAAKFALTRRMNGEFLDTQHVEGKPMLVDCGSVTALLVMGYHRREGDFGAIFFEDYDPYVGTYKLRLDKGAEHVVRTPTGDLRAMFDATGALLESKREVGVSILQTKSLESRAEDKRGLPMPEDKRAAAGAREKAAGQPK